MLSVTDMGRRAADLARDGRLAEAEDVLRDALAHDPRNPVVRYALGISRLADGDYASGWPLYEARRELRSAPPEPKFSFPEWRGETINSLLILPEQGAGDQIQLARYIPALVRQGVSVSLICPMNLTRSFAGLGAALIPATGAVEVPRHDAWVWIGSLPGLMGWIASPPYLRGADGGSGVGVVVAGNPKHPGDAERSIRGADADRLLALGIDLSREATGATDMEATAEIIRGLRCVVSVDTSVAHLSAAMGKPTAILLPYRCDWRWGRTGAATGWYPSVQLIRQDAPGDWSGPLAQVRTWTM